VTPLQASGEAGEYGPVQRGQTLWGIANRISRERGYSVNQLMLAIQQQNPGAFNQGNINSLKAGAVLRLPSRDEVLSFSQDEAMLEVQRQELVWRSGSGSVPAGVDELPVIADLEPVDTVGPAEESTDIDVIAEPGTADEIARGRLELVPPANDDALAADAGIGNTGDENEEGAVSVVEELARTQEELVNAQQENEYLADRIQELEAELARREPDEQDAGLVEDTGLAELEQRLQEQRQAGEEEEVQVIPQDEQRPWLARWTPWVLITLLLAVGAVVWWLRSRRSEDEVVHGITEDAEDILRVLQDEGDVPVGDISTRDNAVEPARVTAPRPPHTDEEAVELDADDPETQLDLARAYLSMGDQQAARTILVGVIESGDAEQVAEARRMMQEV
jgi:pilus assembly protein FimV